MKMNKIYAWMAAAMTLAACSTNDIADLGGNDADNVVNVAATRANTSSNTTKAISSFHLINTTQQEKYNTKYEADYILENNSYTMKNGKAVWYNEDDAPAEGNVFKAFTPLTTAANLASYDRFYIPIYQASPELLAAADWMTATATSTKAAATDGLSLNFEHRNAKLHFDVTVKDDAAALTSEDITVIGNITPYYSADESNKTIEAIVAPVSADEITSSTSRPTLISFRLAGGDEISVPLPTSISQIEAGKQYNFSITVGHNTLTISSVSVTDWTSATITTNDDQAFNDSGIDYVTFTADSEQGFKFVVSTEYPSQTLLPIEGFEYSVNNGPWIAIPGTGMPDFVTFGGDKGKLRLRGKSIGNTGTYRRGENDANGHATVTFSDENVMVDCSGDIRTLIDYENHFVATNNARFMYLFKNCTQLTSAPKLPATDLADNCYFMMFGGCTSLATAPELPATDLADGCYANMFDGCKSLTKAPELPATKLAYGCYYFMFSDCSALTTAPEELPAKELANSCYTGMFCRCTSLTSAPQLPATELANSCYWRMFDGCTLLASPPELPATTLAYSCYYMMFRDCTSLTKAPELPAQTLDMKCYKHIFEGCKKISEIKMLATSYLTTDYMDGWLNYVGKDKSVTSRTLILDSQDAYDALKQNERNLLPHEEWQVGYPGTTVVDINGNAITNNR